MCGIVIALCATLLGLVTLVVGGRIIDAGIAVVDTRLTARTTELTGTVQTRLQAVDDQLNSVRRRVEAQIAKQFEEPQIQRTVQNVAESAAGKVITEHVQPAENMVSERLRDFEKFLDERKAQYDTDQAAFRAEIETLKKRNELTRLADRAVGDGELTEYQQLLRIARDESDPEVKAAALAEEFRVVSAYGALSASRVSAITLDASVISPGKMNESELTLDDLGRVLTTPNVKPMARARAAFLMRDKSPTFSIAESLKKALETETHLEALRFEKVAFAHVCGFKSEKGALDASEELKWWPENVDHLRKELPR